MVTSREFPPPSFVGSPLLRLSPILCSIIPCAGTFRKSIVETSTPQHSLSKRAFRERFHSPPPPPLSISDQNGIVRAFSSVSIERFFIPPRLFLRCLSNPFPYIHSSPARSSFSSNLYLNFFPPTNGINPPPPPPPSPKDKFRCPLVELFLPLRKKAE